MAPKLKADAGNLEVLLKAIKEFIEKVKEQGVCRERGHIHMIFIIVDYYNF